MWNKRVWFGSAMLLLLLPTMVSAEPPMDGSEAKERRLEAKAAPVPESHPTPSPATQQESSGFVFSERDKANFKIVAGVIYKLMKGSGGGNPVWVAIKLSAPDQTSVLSETKESREAREFAREYERHRKEIAKDGFDEHADPKWVRDIEFSDGHPVADSGGN